MLRRGRHSSIQVDSHLDKSIQVGLIGKCIYNKSRPVLNQIEVHVMRTKRHIHSAELMRVHFELSHHEDV